MNLLIRTARLSDAVSLAMLSNQLGYPAEETAIEQRLQSILTLSDHKVLVALNHDKIGGWIHGFQAFRIESDAFVEIGGLVVNEQYRKQGIGKLLVDNLIPWAVSKECTKVRVRCNTLRQESHMFYEHLGFQLNKTQKVFDKNIQH